MQFPNYQHSSFNTINSILNHYGVKNNKETLKSLDDILNAKQYKNIVLLIMDGLGQNIVNKYLNDKFLGQKNIGPISSVFPSTTTAAMNTYYSALSPNEHGWLGWSTFFKECSRTINLFPSTDKYSNEKITFNYLDLIKYKNIFEQIKEVNNINQIVIHPKHIVNNYPVKNIPIKNLKQLVKAIYKNTKKKTNNFIFAYYPEPDHSEHGLGIYNSKIEKILLDFNKLMEKYFKNINDDTLIIISADHGQIDIKETIYLEDYPNLLNTLNMLPSIEPRAASFFVKKEKEDEFVNSFNEIFKDKYHLFTKEEVYNYHLLGHGTPHSKIDDFLGNYLAVATSNTSIDYKRHSDGFEFKGHHAGLTPDEMNIPLIIIKKD